MLIAAFPESDHLRVEVVYRARGLPPLDEVSRSLWIQTPALATLTSPEATLTAHLKTWRLKEYALRTGGSALKEALMMVRDPEQKVKLMATGLSLVLKSELLMTERDLEVNDIALALQVVPDGLQWSSTMSLTPEGERIIRMGLASGMSPRLKVNGASLLDASISFDVNTALAQVHDLDGLQRDETQGRLRSRDLISEMRECGLVCVAHNVIRKPLAMMKFVRQHLSAKVPFINAPWRGAQVALIELNPRSPKAAIAFTLSQDAQPHQVIEQFKQAGMIKPPIQVATRTSPDAQWIMMGIGEGREPIFGERGAQESAKATNTTIGTFTFHGFDELAKLRPLRILSIYRGWRVKMHVSLGSGALEGRLWLGPGRELAPLKRLESMDQREAPVLMTSRPSSPQDQCLQDLFYKTSALFEAITHMSSDRSSSLIKPQLSVIMNHLKCARREPHFTEPTTFLANQMSLLFGMRAGHQDREAYRDFLTSLCELKYSSACEVISSWQKSPVTR